MVTAIYLEDGFITEEKLSHMMKNVGRTTERVFEDADFGELFGV